jgi:uncharacterized protein (TIGR02757 family)
MISAARALVLRPLLDAFRDDRALAERLRADPVEFPHRYTEPRDIEVVGLISAALAYGRVDLFKPKIAQLLAGLGPRPAAAVAGLSPARAARLLDGFVYRFNVAADVAVLLIGIGRTLERSGSLERCFLEERAKAGTWRGALGGFVRRIRGAAPRSAIEQALGPTRGVAHLLPGAEAGAAKRLNLYLRWMVRGPDEIDLGVWRNVSPAALMMPVDTHVARIAGWLGLTGRRTVSWAMVEEITASLRLLDPGDPVKYDFALCHWGMSGACPPVPVPASCRRCPLRSACRHGPTGVRRPGLGG